ncbi:NAD(P)/FAD-dependent oxidoreductase [Flavihumibacter solisilvae]|uniref:Flavoprotein reductase n=1 Tax=Flavihumibacter solisilvae TaxID=1349421 RepID=A0A0C1LFD7_9BACT|nr:FAD-dependent oxidoreductase [Flavihumibacter solisilvae]KIC94043.1 flavoprotein reductase [Flavihumibacter solisilvae]
MKLKVVVAGAGFGGLELSSILSEQLGNDLDLTLIDKSDSFYFGFSKFEVMFGHRTTEEVLVPYEAINKPGVKFIQENITAIDPVERRITTDGGTYQADILVLALGADYDIAGTPGLKESGNEFYSLPGAETLRTILPAFSKGRIVVGVCSTPFKCPPAPSEAALLMHDYLTRRNIRQHCSITLVMPFGLPVPPSPETSKALLKAFEERNIEYIPKQIVREIDPLQKAAVLDDGRVLPFDLFLGIPKHRVPAVVEKSGMTVNGWIPVDPQNLKTNYAGVYAIGDVTSVGTPKAGVFAEGAGRVAAESIIAWWHNKQGPLAYSGEGTCYVEFGGGRVGKVNVNFFSGPKPTGAYTEPSETLLEEKKIFGSSRIQRWFGR